MNRFVIAALVLTAAIAAFLFFTPDDPTPDIRLNDSRPGSELTVSKVETEAAHSQPTDDSADISDAEEGEPEKCSRFRIDHAHPWMAAEAARFESVSPTGPGMAVYQGLSEADLLSLATQEDSGAMVVLATRASLRARGKSEDYAVSQLSGYSNRARSRVPIPDKDSGANPEQALQEAQDWYYKAALHGRIFALVYVGRLQRRLVGGPVELGWIDKQAFEQLERKQRRDFNPFVVYQAAALKLMPQKMASPPMVLALESASVDLDFGDPATIDLVLDEFRTDLQQSGLTLPVIPPYEGPSLEEWREEFCEND
ncbi:MAG: hypothetical protein QNJ05_13125 [Woeseiaceae bacterium]|nr:hypothetical protein [Woeseiaceae bacterium]